MSFLETAFVGALVLVAIGGIAGLVERRRARRQFPKVVSLDHARRRREQKRAGLNAANRRL